MPQGGVGVHRPGSTDVLRPDRADVLQPDGPDVVQCGVDVHQHLWPPEFVDALRSRDTAPRLVGWTRQAGDRESQHALWELSEKATGITYP